MPFKETCPVEERISMLREYDSGLFSAAEVARRANVSRDIFYFWLARRNSGEERWFEARSHATRNCPHRTKDEQIDAILAMRDRFPSFGPKKIKAKLAMNEPGTNWPAASTIGDILKRNGRVIAKPKRRKAVLRGDVFAGADRPNEEWAIDFKGWFRTRDGTRCDPLTVSDTASRYLLEARIVPPTFKGVFAAMEQLFSDVGLPDAIRSDNGAPFGSTGAGGLSKLSVWFLKLGIEPRYIPPASPQDNGRHERMHRTLKAETTRPPSDCWQQQQVRFNLFCDYYNEERPHEALGQTPPVAHWYAPQRKLPNRIDEPWYDADHEVRRVRGSGEIKWRGDHIFIGQALSGEPVGLTELEDGSYLVRFCHRELGVIGNDSCFRRFAPPRVRLHYAAETG